MTPSALMQLRRKGFTTCNLHANSHYCSTRPCSPLVPRVPTCRHAWLPACMHACLHACCSSCWCGMFLCRPISAAAATTNLYNGTPPCPPWPATWGFSSWSMHAGSHYCSQPPTWRDSRARPGQRHIRVSHPVHAPRRPWHDAPLCPPKPVTCSFHNMHASLHYCSQPPNCCRAPQSTPSMPVRTAAPSRPPGAIVALVLEPGAP